jgi:ABC-type multidrug transport system ATPase subunit
MIEAPQLSKNFSYKKRGEVRVVDFVSFRCAPGVIYGLLGANGAGKTSTLRSRVPARPGFRRLTAEISSYPLWN